MKPTEISEIKSAAQHEDSALVLHSEFTAIVREEIGMNEGFASQIAAAIVRGMRLRYGTQSLYVPSLGNQDRDAAIRSEFHGTNAGEICRKYRISRSRLYQIVGQQERKV